MPGQPRELLSNLPGHHQHRLPGDGVPQGVAGVPQGGEGRGFFPVAQGHRDEFPAHCPISEGHPA